MILMMVMTACTPDTEIVQVTRPVVVATEVVATAVPLPPSPIMTLTPPNIPTLAAEPPLTVEPTITLEPTAVPTPEFIWPTESIIFFNDDSLKKWSPQSGEVTILAENIDLGPIYAADIAVFTREIKPQEEYALIVFHIPTQSEFEVTRVTSRVSPGTISPNGRWLAYIANNFPAESPLLVHEIIFDDQQLSVSPPILTITPSGGRWDWPYGELTWPTENELSWNDQDGIWLADLEAGPIEPTIVIEPSTNTYQVYSMNPADSDKEPRYANTIYIPYQWSPDSRYLLVIDKRLGEEYTSTFRVIESFTNRSFEIIDSAIGAISDKALWLDNTHLLHYSTMDGMVYIWSITSGNDSLLEQDNTFPPISISNNSYLETRDWLPLPNNHVRFAARGSSRDYLTSVLLDLDLEQGIVSNISTEFKHEYRGFQWSSADAKYAIWSYAGEPGTFLDDLSGDAPKNVNEIFGERSCCWYWYEE